MSARRRSCGAVAAVAGALAAAVAFPAAAGAAPAPAPPRLLVEDSAAGLAVMGDLHRPASRVTIEVHTGDDLRQVQLVRLARGYTLAAMQDDAAAADAGDPAALDRYYAHVDLLGGVAVAPHHPASFTETLYAGTYYLFDADSGAYRTLEVHGPVRPTAFPDYQSHVAAIDFQWLRPRGPVPHRGVMLLTNRGRQAHVLELIRVDRGTTLAQLHAMLVALANDPEADLPGWLHPDDDTGTGALSPGRQMLWSYDLPPGTYAMFCWVGDPSRDGMPHVLEGQYNLITLR